MAQTSGPARFFFLRSPIRAGRVPPFFLTRKPRIPSPPLYKDPSPLSPTALFFCICSRRRPWPHLFLLLGAASAPCAQLPLACALYCAGLPPAPRRPGSRALPPLRRPPPVLCLCMQRPPRCAAASSAICAACRAVLHATLPPCALPLCCRREFLLFPSN